MIIEKPGFYKTRDGQRAEVRWTNGKEPYSCIGYLDNILVHWTPNGECISQYLPDRRIVAPWVDAPVVDWAAMPKWAKYVFYRPSTGCWCGNSRVPEILPKENDWFVAASYSEYFRIPPEYAPKWDGDWRDSLVERPEGV